MSVGASETASTWEADADHVVNHEFRNVYITRLNELHTQHMEW